MKFKKTGWYLILPLCLTTSIQTIDAKTRTQIVASPTVSQSEPLKPGQVLSNGNTVTAEYNDRYWFIKNEKGENGFCDNHGSIVIPPSEYETRPLGSDRFLRFIYNDKGELRQELLGPGGVHIGDLPSKIIVQGDKYHDGLLRVEGLHELGPYTGYLDLKGEFKIKPSKFLFGSDFQEGFAHADINENGTSKAVIIDTNGQIVKIPFPDGALGEFYDGLAIVTNSALQRGLVDRTFRKVLPVEYQQISQQGKYLLAYKDGSWHVFSKDGTLVLDVPKSITSISTNGTDDVWTVATGGEPTTDPGFNKRENRTYGAIDKTGKIVVPLTHKYIGEFYGGIAKFGYKQGKHGELLFGTINTKGKIVRPCVYEYVDVSDGYTKLTKESEVKFDKALWNSHSGRPAQWRHFLKDYKLIGMKKEKLLSLLGSPDVEPDHNRGHYLYIISTVICGNMGGGRSVEIEVDRNQTVTGWRDVASYGHSAWNRKNDRYKQWTSSVFDNMELPVVTVPGT